METHRKPYERPVKRSWWLERRKYALYMIRELTALTNLWIVAEIMWFIALCALNGDRAQADIAHILENRGVIAANIAALAGAAYHMATWHKIFPSGIRIFRSSDPGETRLMPRSAWMLILYGATIAASAIILIALSFGD